jgi:hypothetical protein
MGATQARTYVHELSEKRFIAIEQRPGSSGVYKFLWHEAFAGEIGDKRKAPPLRKTGFTVFARLKPGVSLEQAQAEMDVFGRRLAHDEPQLNRDWAVAVAGLRQHYFSGWRQAFL